MNIRFLESFVWLARLRSFSATAERLNTTQPAISARLRTLERELGVELIFRTSREVRLTPEGLGILRRVEGILELVHQLPYDGATDGQPGGIVRIGVVDAIVRTWLPRLMERLAERYPKLSLELTVDTTVQLAKGLREGDLHLIVAIEPISDSHFTAEPICRYAMGWVASPRLVDPSRAYAPEELASLPIISYLPHSPPDRLITDYFGEIDLKHARINASNSMSSMIRLAGDGLGIAAVPPICVAGEIAEGGLCVIGTSRPFSPLTFFASRHAAPANRTVEAVLSGLREAARDFAESSDPKLAWMP